MGAIDADAHVIETVQTWSYLEGDERRFTPQLMTQNFGADLLSNEGIAVPDFWVIEGRAHGKDRNVGTDTSKESREMLSVEARLAHMDELGIEIQVLYPTLFLRPVVQDAERERALCKSYNRWLADLWRRAEGRLRWVAKPPLRLLEKAPAAVRDELEWAKNNGACGIFMRGLECERGLGSAYFYPLWEMSGELDLPVCIHSANGSFIHHDFFNDDTTFTKFKLAVVGAFHTLFEKELPRKFPNVRWGFVEVSAQWVPYVLNDLADRFRRQGRSFPSDALAANNMWVACENTDDLPYVMSHAGEDCLMIGTDYGHHDPSTELDAIHLLRNDKRIEPRAARKILETNPRKFYHL
ncbi:MAG: amidohydrolase [Deltaproteobacteria bacterium]|nr:amidohydrolase [Deltaproteobacteria bacterium]